MYHSREDVEKALMNERYFSDVPERLPFSPCIGSGYCCKTAPCVIAMVKYKDLGPWQRGEGCPSLRFDAPDDRYYCGEVLDAQGAEQERLKDFLHIGAGCCSSLNSDRQEKLRKRKERTT